MLLNSRTPFCVLLALLGISPAGAQVKAGFSASETGGCSPITVTFTNNTTGASKNATYTWDFGNGNKITTPDSTYSSGATYVDQNTYSVVLTVTDGGSTYSKTLVITVFSNPSVNFNISAGVSGCAPVTASFGSTSTAGSGTISAYFWDFGDGTTQAGTTPTISHTYTYPGSPAVQLTVTNSDGCSATLEKPGLLTVSSSLLPSFSTDSTTLCSLSDPVPFNNTTTGPPALTYLWKFGDGSTSTAAAPPHTYSAKGIYNVTLIATSSIGCTDSVEKIAYVDAQDFNPVFTVPSPICTGVQQYFQDNSNPAGTRGSEVWTFSDQYGSDDGYGAYHVYSQPGNYTVTMTTLYGNCLVGVTEPVTVFQPPSLPAFVMQPATLCGAPETVTFTDTSSAPVKWAWYSSYYYTGDAPFSTAQSASFTYTANADYQPTLVITDAHGCTANVTEPLYVAPATAQFVVESAEAPSLIACGSLTVNCSAVSSVPITQYSWNFGDGTTSASATPTHTYPKPGTYEVSLSFVNSNGCTGTGYGNQQVTVNPAPTAAFTFLPASPVCGNTPVHFTNLSTNASYYTWNFGDANSATSQETSYPVPTYQYTREGTYTITLIATSYGSGPGCRDTLVKTNVITILPPFPQILSQTNTCTGTRGQVSFTDSLREANTWTWSFGDGQTQTGTGVMDGLTHTYTKTGDYKVYLTATNGACTVKDSVTVPILLKQRPVLSSAQTSVCAISGSLDVQIANLDTNFAAYSIYSYENANGYYPSAWQYGDGSTFSNNWEEAYSGNVISYDADLVNFLPGKDSIRVILESYYFGCADTSNYIPVKFLGPVAGFTDQGALCYKSPVTFTDTSKPSFGVPIVKWQWSFGDGTAGTLTDANGLQTGSTVHVYTTPGTYYPSLIVTDSAGCFANAYSDYGVQVNGPKAAFYWSPSNITPGTTAAFYNNSTGPYTSALWSFTSDGSTSQNLNSVNHTYPNITTDTVTLIVYSSQPGTCPSDTSVQVIPVRNVNAAFTYTSSYVNGNSCPPVVFYFNSTTFNVTGWAWDFGDGAAAEGNPDPSHTYTKPGKYFITLAASGVGATITVLDSVIVKGPYATVSVDLPQSCAPTSVTLKAVATNAVSFIWDFGDGTVMSDADTVLSHTYTIPGIYTPTLTLEDSLGCKASFNTGGTVLADSLHAQVQADRTHVCDSGLVTYSPSVYSISEAQAGDTLHYHWNFGTSNPGDTSDSQAPSFNYTTPGKYLVRLTVTSVPGCLSSSIDSILVTSSDQGLITGPTVACAGDSLRFSGAAATPAPVTWDWLFPSGLTDTAQHAQPITLLAGTYTVRLVAGLNACYDTTQKNLVIHPLPAIALTPDSARICLGDSVGLTAHDGVSYQWTAAPGLSSYTTDDPMATPAIPTTYTVQVTTAYGCTASDSANIFVARPFQLTLEPDTFVCKGDTIRLTPGGAYTYQWISGSPISDPASASPGVAPLVTTTYTVVGTDRDDCFTDTAAVTVAVEPLPTVQATPINTLPAGNSTPLAVTGSADVVSWAWAPPDYLSCTDCADPVSTPQRDITYTVTGETAKGCTASDTVRITLVCLEDRVEIPKAFTPNNDGYNDIFYPRGKGIRAVSHFRIFGRWGNLVFERENVPLDDPSAGWDGTTDGKDQPVGAYVYEIELICDTGDVFVLKGTVLLER